MNNIEVKLQTINPLGDVEKSMTLKMPLEPIDAMKRERLFLYVGDCLYSVDRNGFIIERMIPHENSPEL